MATTFDLESFLSQQGGEGRFDSSGAFTLAVEKAAAKLARFSLPRPEAWVLKLLQAAYGWGANELLLTQTQLTSRFALRPSLRYGLPRPEEIVETFLGGDLRGHDPLSQFCLALRALGEQAEFPFLLVIDYGSGQPSIVNSGLLEAKQVATRASRPEYLFPQGIALTVGHLKAGEGRFRGLLSPAKMAGRSWAILAELFAQAPYCSVPLFFDSRPINNWDPQRIPSERPFQAALIASRAIRTSSRNYRPRIVPRDLQQGIWYPAFPRLVRGSPPPLQVEADGLFRLWHRPTQVPTNQQRPSLLRWVAGGVVVGRNLVATDGPLYCELLIDASDLPVDLSGLALIDSPQYQSRWTLAVAQLEAELDRVIALSSSFPPELVRALQVLRQGLDVSRELDPAF